MTQFYLIFSPFRLILPITPDFLFLHIPLVFVVGGVDDVIEQVTREEKEQANVSIAIPRRVNDTRLNVQRVDNRRRRRGNTAFVIVVRVVKSEVEVDELRGKKKSKSKSVSLIRSAWINELVE